MNARSSRFTMSACCLTLFAIAAMGQTTAGRNAEQGAPVVLNGRTLFLVRANLGPFSAVDRATAASTRLLAVSKDLTIPTDAVTSQVSDTSTDIVAGDRILLTISDADARAVGIGRAELVATYVQRIRAALAQARAAYSYRSIAIGLLYTALATVILLAFLWLIRKAFPVLAQKVSASRGTLIRSVRLQRAELLSAERIAGFLVACLKLLRALLIVTVLYIYIPLVLSFFPWTREYTPTLFGYIVDPLSAAARALISYLPNLFIIIIASVIAYICTRLSRFVFDHLAQGTITWSGFYAEWANPTHKIVRFLILAFTAVVIFPYLPGSASPAFRGISIFLGVLFSLGSTSAVANVVAGTILTYTRAFQVGDRVRIADTTGDVVEKTLLATRVQTIKNELVTVPNALLLGSHITNFSSAAATGRDLILHTSVTIGYDAPWRTVHELLTAAALRTSGICQEPRPFVLQTALDDFYIHYEINAYTNEPSRMAVIYGELHQNIQDSFNEAGMEIMSPHFSSLRDGNRRAIPDAYLPADYAAPSFRIKNQRTAVGAEQ